ncbi:MAG TPA: hypothetical protein VGD31_13385, partial [Sphingobacteriaceae bacterium]
MIHTGEATINFKQALYLAFTALCIYYPIIISANIPLQHWSSIQFLAIPAFFHFGFFVFLIIAIDRIIDSVEKRRGPRILELRLPTIVLSIVVGVVAVVLSQLVIKLNYKFWSMLTELMTREEMRNAGNEAPQFAWWQALRRTNFGMTLVISISIF